MTSPLPFRGPAAAAIVLALTAFPLAGQEAGALLDRSILERQERWNDAAMRIWEWAEVGYQEERSSALLQEELRAHGFRVEAGVAGIPTAFMAEWGSGGPLVGILAEFDALPGFSQTASPVREPFAGQIAGHACGHHLFGVGSVAAAVAVREWLEASGTPGRVRVYGTPAEEGGSGKVYMVRDGLFDDADVVLHWHPSSENSAGASVTMANKSGKFRFTGVSAHAASAPHRGRSALDGVEAMNHMANLLREHVPDGTRIHYVITSGGSAPNVVPDFAEVYYYVRHVDATLVESIWERIEAAARGAALGTGTEVAVEVTGGVWSQLPNETLQRLLHAALTEVGGVTYTDDERRFALELQESFEGFARPSLDEAVRVQPYRSGGLTPASTDAGDVSWAVASGTVSTATWVPGTAAHSWQAVAAGGTGIGLKGMTVAARALARAAVMVYQDASVVAAAKAELAAARGPDFVYRPLVGDRPPALDYRAAAGG